VQERKLAHTSFPHWWNDVVQDVFVLVQEGVQEGKLGCASFPPQKDDVVQDAPCLCKRER
jgi:hypothetical protein